MSDVVNQGDNKTARIPLIQLLDRLQRWFEERILHEVESRNGKAIQPADLKLLANLDCGATYASEVARRMGISRQSVNKLLKNLLREGMVTLEDHPTQKNAKLIVITDEGGAWIQEAVAVSNRLEQELAETIGKANASTLRRALETAWSNWNA